MPEATEAFLLRPNTPALQPGRKVGGADISPEMLKIACRDLHEQPAFNKNSGQNSDQSSIIKSSEDLLLNEPSAHNSNLLEDKSQRIRDKAPLDLGEVGPYAALFSLAELEALAKAAWELREQLDAKPIYQPVPNKLPYPKGGRRSTETARLIVDASQLAAISCDGADRGEAFSSPLLPGYQRSFAQRARSAVQSEETAARTPSPVCGPAVAFLISQYGYDIANGDLGPGALADVDRALYNSVRYELTNQPTARTVSELFDSIRFPEASQASTQQLRQSLNAILGSKPERARRFFGSIHMLEREDKRESGGSPAR